MRLAAVELQHKGKRRGVDAGLLGGAGVLAFYGGAALITALILGLATQILVPEEATASVKADINTIKEGMHR